MGTQEYRFTSAEFLARFEQTYGAQAASEIAPHLNF
jgi:adenosine kinase